MILSSYNSSRITQRELMRKMEAQLPIPARPGDVLMRLMRQQGVKLARHQELFIKRVIYMGDEEGISCNVTPPDLVKTPTICSIRQVCQFSGVNVPPLETA